MRRSHVVTRAVRRALVLSGCAVSFGVGSAAQAQSPEPALDEVAITGTRIVTPNLEAISPVTSISAEEIVRTGKSTIEDIVNELPQLSAALGANNTNFSDGTATVNLRGLGSNRTLVLVNGRRLQPGDPNGNFAADVNMIPTALVKRVEVLTGGASATYGADAVAGVVNFIMDDRFEGVRFSAGYSFFNHSNDDAASQAVLRNSGFELPDSTVNVGHDRNFSFVVGSNFADGGGNATFYATYRETDEVLQRDYDFSACTLGSGVSFACTGSSTSFPARFRPINPVTGSPVGNYTLNPTTGAFVAGTPALYNVGPPKHFQVPNERYTAGVFLHYAASDRASVYGEFKYLKDQSLAGIAPSGIFLSTFTVSCANPFWGAAEFNAFCGQFGLTAADDTVIEFRRRNVEGGGRVQDLNHNSYHAVAGVRGLINDAWSYDAYATNGSSRISNTFLNDFSLSRVGRALDVITDPATGQPACRSVVNGNDDGCVPYNLFDLGQVTREALAYMQLPLIELGEVTENVVIASFTGQLGQYGVKLPSAEEGMIVNVGLEYRSVDSDYQPDGSYLSGEVGGPDRPNGSPLSGGYRANELFGEARLPILSNLSAEAGYRYAEYDGGFSASTDTYKLGFEWSPIDAARLRGSFQSAVRVPNIGELLSGQGTGIGGTLDPCAGPNPALTVQQCQRTGLDPALYGNIEASPLAQYVGLLGGNPSLQPEAADTLSFGVAFQPSFVPGLRLQLDWYDIQIDDPIQRPNQDFTLLGCAVTGSPALCSKVNRDSNGSLWETDGFVVDTLENIGELRSSGIDIDASYDFGIGSYGKTRVGLIGTFLDKFEFTPQPGFTYDCVGLYGGICSPGAPNGAPTPEWRHKADVTWMAPWRSLEINLAWRYFGEVKRELEDSQEALAFLGSASQVLPTDSRLGSRSWFDVSAAITVFELATIRVGANNLFDKDPPIVGRSTCPTGPCNGNVWAQAYDALGRQIFATVNVEF